MSDIHFQCPVCGQSLDAPPDMSGEEIECPSCQRPIFVPKIQASPPQGRKRIVVHHKAQTAPSRLTSRPNTTGSELTCPKCSARNKPGTRHCVECKKSLMPGFLSFMALMATAVGLGWTVFLFMFAFDSESWSEPTYIIQIPQALVLLVVGFGLNFGRFWAWLLLQLLYGLNIVVQLIKMAQAIFSTNPLPGLIQGIGGILIISLFWCYLRSARVKAYCSA